MLSSQAKTDTVNREEILSNQAELISKQALVQEKQSSLLSSQAKTDTYNRDNILPLQSLKIQTDTQIGLANIDVAKANVKISEAKVKVEEANVNIAEQSIVKVIAESQNLLEQKDLIEAQTNTQYKQANLLDSQAKTDTVNREKVLPSQANLIKSQTTVQIAQNRLINSQADTDTYNRNNILSKQSELIDSQKKVQDSQKLLIDSQADTDTYNRNHVLPAQEHLIYSQAKTQIQQSKLLDSQSKTDTFNRNNILPKQKDLIVAQTKVQSAQKDLVNEQTKTQEVNTYLTEAKMEVELGYEIASTGLKKKDDFENSLSGLNIKKVDNEVELVKNQSKVQKMQGVGLQLKTFYDTGVLADDIVSNNSLKFETDNNQLIVKYGDNTTIEHSTLLQQIRALKGQTVGYDKTVQLKVLELVSKIITDSLSTDDIEPPKWAVETFVYLTSQVGKSAFADTTGTNLDLKYSDKVFNIDDVLLQLQTTYGLGYLSNLGIVDSTTGLLNDGWKVYKVSVNDNDNTLNLIDDSKNSIFFTKQANVSAPLKIEKEENDNTYQLKDSQDVVLIDSIDNANESNKIRFLVTSANNYLFIPQSNLHELGLNDGISLTNYHTAISQSNDTSSNT